MFLSLFFVFKFDRNQPRVVEHKYFFFSSDNYNMLLTLQLESFLPRPQTLYVWAIANLTTIPMAKCK